MTAKKFAAIQPIYSAVSAKGFKFLFDRMKSVPNRSDWALFQGPYELCAFDCCSLVDAWAIGIRLKPENTPIRIVFGRGNTDRHWLELGYKAEYGKKPDTHLSPEPLFEEDDTNLLPLQAADLYAWEIARSYANPNENRESLKILMEIKPLHHIWR